MKQRATDWEPTKLELLKDPEVAQGYIQACLEEGVPLQEALGAVIRAQGLTKVAGKTRLAVPNVIRAVRKGANPTFDTLQRLLFGVGLDISVRLRK